MPEIWLSRLFLLQTAKEDWRSLLWSSKYYYHLLFVLWPGLPAPVRHWGSIEVGIVQTDGKKGSPSPQRDHNLRCNSCFLSLISVIFSFCPADVPTGKLISMELKGASLFFTLQFSNVGRWHWYSPALKAIYGKPHLNFQPHLLVPLKRRVWAFHAASII